jgi:hypothetical protein
MRPADLSRLMSKLHDAGLAADAWSEALQSLSDAVGLAGAAYITFNKITGRVDWACFSGLSEGAKPEYVRRYAALDPYSPLLDASWMKLSECLPDALLRRSEWYAEKRVVQRLRPGLRRSRHCRNAAVRDAIVPGDFRRTPADRPRAPAQSRLDPQHRDGIAAARGAFAHGKPGDPEQRRIRRAASRDGYGRVTFLFPCLQRPPIS